MLLKIQNVKTQISQQNLKFAAFKLDGFLPKIIINTYLEHSDCSMSCFFFGFNFVAHILQRRLSVWPIFPLETWTITVNNINSIPRSTDTDSLLTHTDVKSKNRNHAQKAKCTEQQLSRKFFPSCKIQLIINAFTLIRGRFYFACNCDFSSRLLICWSQVEIFISAPLRLNSSRQNKSYF